MPMYLKHAHKILLLWFFILGKFNLFSQAPLCYVGVSNADTYSVSSSFDSKNNGIDINQDGYIDFIGFENRKDVTNTYTFHAVAIYYGNATANYSASVQYSVNYLVGGQFCYEDINNDGVKDVAARCSYGIVVLIGNLNGSFNPVPIYSPCTVVYFSVKDITGDGKMDVIDYTGNAVRVFPGNGSGTFSSGYSIGANNSSLNTAVITDFNSDGKLDVIACGLSSSVTVINTDVTGNFFASSTSYSTGGALTQNCFLLKDFSGDGKPDAIVSNSLGLKVLIHNGSSGFLPAVTYLGTLSLISSFIDYDFNNDGALDLIVGNNNNRMLNILINSGTGTFSVVSSYSVGENPLDIRCVDLNADGLVDVLGLNSNNNAFLLLGSGAGNFAAPSFFSVGNLPVGFSKIADVNADGLIDIVAQTYSETLTVIKGTAVGQFKTSVNEPFRSGYGTVLEDFNADGNLDYAQNNSTNQISIYEGNGSGTFSLATNFASQASSNLIAGDFNSDGRKDIVFCTSNSIRTYTRSIAGTYGLAASFGPLSTGAIAKGDWNNDGNLDVAVSGYSGSGAGVFFGAGTGTFTNTAGFLCGSGPTSLLGKDFNNDGNLDIAVTSQWSSAVYISLGSASGTFAPATSYSTGIEPLYLASADWNNDGNFDLVVSNRGSNSVKVLLGQGNGSFTPSTTYTAFPQPFGVVAADFNLDGNSDICVYAANTGTHRFLMGNGSGSFSIGASYYLHRADGDIAVGDVNNDGRPDIISSNVAYLLSGAPVITISGPSVSCSGASISLVASGASTYSWSTGSTSQIVSVQPTAATIYTVWAADNQGCIAAAAKTINTLPFSTTPVSIAGPTLACLGSVKNYSAQGASTYTWSNGLINSARSVSVTSNFTIAVNASDSNGCPSSAVFSVVAIPKPPVSISGLQYTCSSIPISFTATGASSYTWNSGATTTVTTLIPPASTVYAVTGTGTNGCTSTFSLPVTILASPSLIVTAPATVCVGTILNFSATGASTLYWSNNTFGPIGSLSITSNYFQYFVTGINANGCTSTYTAALPANTPSQVSISGQNTVCAGEQIILVANGASTYTWSNVNVGQSFTAAPFTNTNYSVVATDANGCSSTASYYIYVSQKPSIAVAGATLACPSISNTLVASGAQTYTWSNLVTGSTTVVAPTTTTTYVVQGYDSNFYPCPTNSAAITISILPAPQLSITAIQTNSCGGSPVLLNGSGANVYSWSSGAFGPTVVVTPTASSSYSLQGLSTNGCIGTQTITVAVLPLPTITSSPQIACSSQTTTLNLSGANSYTWALGGNSSSVSLLPTSSFTYSALGTDSNNCTATYTANFTVYTTPTVTIAGPSTLCVGSVATLSASGAASYSWVGIGTNSTASVMPLANTNYTVVGFSVGSCSNSTGFLVNVLPLPSFTITASQQTICSGSTLTLSASGAASYNWNNGNTGSTFSLQPFATTKYKVLATGNNGCTKNDSIIVVVKAKPNVIAASGAALPCAGESVTLTSFGALTYTWSTGAVGNSVVVIPLSTIVYTVQGMDSFGCVNSNTVIQQVLKCLSIDAKTSDLAIAVYPNPFQSSIEIVNHTNTENTKYVICDQLGRKLAEVCAKDEIQKINLEELPLGNYFLMISIDGKIANVYKLIKSQ